MCEGSRGAKQINLRASELKSQDGDQVCPAPRFCSCCQCWGSYSKRQGPATPNGLAQLEFFSRGHFSSEVEAGSQSANDQIKDSLSCTSVQEK